MSKDTIKRLMKYCGSLDDALDLLDEMEVKPKAASSAKKTVPSTGKKQLRKTKGVRGILDGKPTESSQIVELIKKTPNKTVAELVDMSGIAQNRVSSVCSVMVKRKVLIRKKNDDGTFVYRTPLRNGLQQQA